jgi:hypothetical protein
MYPLIVAVMVTATITMETSVSTRVMALRRERRLNSMFMLRWLMAVLHPSSGCLRMLFRFRLWDYHLKLATPQHPFAIE